MNGSKHTKGLLERLRDGVVVGDGGYVFALEKRGYVKAGPFTPEAAVEHPDAVEQLHKEFLRAGSDVLQAFTFYGGDDKLAAGHVNHSNCPRKITCKSIIESGCQIARKVADSGGALMAGSISESVGYSQGKGKTHIQSEVRKQMDIFEEQDCDFIICEFFGYIEEMEWTIEECVKGKLPVVASMRIGGFGDANDVSPGECAIRMAKAGAHVVGVNCAFGPETTIETIKIMKKALDEEGLHPYLITQANGFNTTGSGRFGYLECPEYPFAMEPRTVTRIDVQKYARAAYEAGVRYIGGCCGFEAYHIRALSEELAPERGFLPKASEKSEPCAAALKLSSFDFIRARANKEYWNNLVPCSGRF